MRYSEIKTICKKLHEEFCFYRHPQKDFVKILGKETVDKLVSKGWLNPSDKIIYIRDYNDPCYEFSNKFKFLFDFVLTPKWWWFKIYVLRIYWFKNKWYRFRIWTGHHYEWMDYEGVDISEI